MAAVFPKISMCAVETEKLRQLRAGEKESDATLETCHDAFGNKIYNDARFHKPRQQRGSCGERSEATCIAARDLAKRRASEQRNRGCNCDNRVTGTTKQPKDE